MRRWRVLGFVCVAGLLILAGCGQLQPSEVQYERAPSDTPASSVLQGGLIGSADPSALAARDLNGISPYALDLAAVKEGPLAKVGGALAVLYTASTDPGSISTRSLGAVPTVITVDAVAVDDVDGLLAQLQALGLQNGQAFGRVVSGHLPVASIADAAALSDLLQMRPALAMTHVGVVTSEADRTVRSDDVRRKLGFDGSGLMVGILSDSFARINAPGCQANPTQGIRQPNGSYVAATYADDVATGDLPAGVDILDDSAVCGGLIDEGRAMAQLVYDLAPGVDLAFHSAFAGGQAGFAQGILDLADAGADVIVDDVIYFAEPMFQDGIIAQAVDQVVARGVPYFSSAGNQSNQSYEAPFRNSGVAAPFGLGMFHDWDPGRGTQLCQMFTLQAGQSVFPILQWDEPFASASLSSPGSSSDVDLYFTDGDCNLLGGSANDNLGGDPVEGFVVDATGPVEFGIAIVLFDGPEPGLLKYVNFGTAGVAFDPPLGASTSYGHSNAADGRGVAAAFYADSPAFGSRRVLEDFSSHGGVPTLFDVDGTRLARPIVRQQPDLAAPDGTNTTFFFSDTVRDDDDGDGIFESRETGEFPNFFGTSAAAPHAAAVAALLLQADPSLTAFDVYDIMETSAQNIGRKRVDFESGWGLINAYTALRRTVGNGR